MKKKDDWQDIIYIQSVLGGNIDDFKFLVDKYKNQIFTLIFRMVNDYHVAEDLAQETFIKAYTSLKKYKIEYSFYNWLYTIALNLTRNYLKRRKIIGFVSFNKGDADLPIASNEDVEESVERDMESEKLRMTLEKLPIKYREVLILRIAEEMSYDEISKVLKIPIGTVETRIHRAKEKLKKMLKK